MNAKESAKPKTTPQRLLENIEADTHLSGDDLTIYKYLKEHKDLKIL